MKTIADAAMTAIEAGEALVTGAVEIFPVSVTSSLFTYGAEFDYQIPASVVDADPVSGIVPPSSGFDDTAAAPFGYSSVGFPLTPPHPIATAWMPQTSLWLKKVVTTGTGTLTLSGHVDNGAVFYLDDVLVGSINADFSQTPFPTSGLPYTITTPVTAGEHTIKILALDDIATSSGDNTYFYCEATQTVGSTSGDGAIGDPVRLWGGYGPITLDGNVYQGIGDRGLVQQTGSALGGVAQGMTIGLSGIEPEVADMVDTTGLHGASVIIHRLIFASDGKTLLDHAIWDRGRIDTIDRDEEIGGAASIMLGVESAARGLGHSGARMRADADQRLIDASDGYFKKTASAPFVTLYWGGRKPTHWGGSATRGFT